MENLIERIKAKSVQITEKRLVFFNRLKELQQTISDAVGKITIYAQSKSVDLDMIGNDEWVYGYLYYQDGTIKIAHRSTIEDFSYSSNNVPEEEQSYNVKKINECQIEWLEKLSSEETIKSLLIDIENSIDAVCEESNKSINSLDKALAIQSSTISDDLLKELKSLDDNNLHSEWLKARSKILIDPSDSITRSSSYLESVCHKVLKDLSEPLPKTIDITNLINAVVKKIKLAEDNEAENDLKQLFGGVKGIFQSIGTLRTHFGTAHGKIPGSYKMDEQCARLANDTAAAVSVFVLKRFEQKLKQGI